MCYRKAVVSNITTCKYMIKSLPVGPFWDGGYRHHSISNFFLITHSQFLNINEQTTPATFLVYHATYDYGAGGLATFLKMFFEVRYN